MVPHKLPVFEISVSHTKNTTHGPDLALCAVLAPRMQSARCLKDFLESDLEAAEARAEAAVDALLWDRDTMADPDKRLEMEVDELRARLQRLEPRQKQLKVTKFFTRNS